MIVEELNHQGKTRALLADGDRAWTTGERYEPSLNSIYVLFWTYDLLMSYQLAQVNLGVRSSIREWNLPSGSQVGTAWELEPSSRELGGADAGVVSCTALVVGHMWIGLASGALRVFDIACGEHNPNNTQMPSFLHFENRLMIESK